MPLSILKIVLFCNAKPLRIAPEITRYHDADLWSIDMMRLEIVFHHAWSGDNIIEVKRFLMQITVIAGEGDSVLRPYCTDKESKVASVARLFIDDGRRIV